MSLSERTSNAAIGAATAGRTRAVRGEQADFRSANPKLIKCTVSLANVIRKGRRVVIAEGTDKEEINSVEKVIKSHDKKLGVAVVLTHNLQFVHEKGTLVRAILEKASETATAAANGNTIWSGANDGGTRKAISATPSAREVTAFSGIDSIDNQETAEKRTEEERTIVGSKGRINAVCFATVDKPRYEITLQRAPSKRAHETTYSSWRDAFAFLRAYQLDHPEYDSNEHCEACKKMAKVRKVENTACTHVDKTTVRECASKQRRYRGWLVTKKFVSINGDPGAYVFTGSSDTTVKMLDATSGKQLHIFTHHSAPVLGLSVSDDHKWLLSSSADKRCLLYNIELLRERLHEKGDLFDGDYFHPTASFGDSSFGSDFDTKSIYSEYSHSSVERETASVLGHDKAVNGGLFARGKDPAFMVTYGQDARTLRYSLASIHANPMLPADEREPIPFVLEYAGDRVRGRAGDPVPTGPIRSACFDNPEDLTAPQQFIFTASDDKALRQYNVDTGGLLRIIVGHTDHCTACILSTDNRFLFSGSLDKSVAMFHIPWAPTTADLKYIEDKVSQWLIAHSKSLLGSSNSVDADDFVVGAQIHLGDPHPEVVVVLLPTGTGDEFGATKEIKSTWNTLNKFVHLAALFLDHQPTPQKSPSGSGFLDLPSAPWDSAAENRVRSVAHVCVVKKSASKRFWGHMGLRANAGTDAANFKETSFGALVRGEIMPAIERASAGVLTEEDRTLMDEQQLLQLRSCDWDLEERDRRRWMSNHQPKQPTPMATSTPSTSAKARRRTRSFLIGPAREMSRFLEPSERQGILQIQVSTDDQFVFASGTAGVVHQYDVNTNVCVRTFKTSGGRPYPIHDFALARGKQYRHSRERERVAIEGATLCKKKWVALSTQEKELLEDSGCFAGLERAFAKVDQSPEKIEAMKAKWFHNTKNHAKVISKAFVSKNVAYVPDQHLVTVSTSGVVATFALTTDAPVRRYAKYESAVQNMQLYNSKSHNCVLTMGLGEARLKSGDGADGDAQSFAPSSIASSLMDQGESVEMVSVMTLVHRDTGTVIRLPERKMGVPREANCFCVPAAHLNKEGIKRVGEKFAAMYIHSVPNEDKHTWDDEGSRFIELFDLTIVLRKMKAFQTEIVRKRKEIDATRQDYKDYRRNTGGGGDLKILAAKLAEVQSMQRKYESFLKTGPKQIEEASIEENPLTVCCCLFADGNM